MSPLILVGGGFLLLCLGMGLGYLFAHSAKKREASKANDIQIELDDYRQRVTEHFAETAEHFESIGQQYRSLYKHMASGANGLCDTTKSAALLGFAASDPSVIDNDAADAAVVPPEKIRDYALEDEDETTAATAELDTAVSVGDEELPSETEEIKDGDVQSELAAETGALLDRDDSAQLSGENDPVAMTTGEEVAVEKGANADDVPTERIVH